MSASWPPRVLVLATGAAADPQTRPALMLAHALGSLGAEVHLVTGEPPPGLEALSALAPGQLWRHALTDDLDGLMQARPDWVVAAPPLALPPEVLAAWLDVLHAAEARLALLHPAPPSWPVPPGAWDAVRSLGRLGGLVLSAGASAGRQARTLHEGWAGRLRFALWPPAIDSLTARLALGQARDGSVLVPLPPAGPEEALALLARLDPGLLAGRVLRLLASPSAPPAPGAVAAVRQALAGVELDMLAPATEEERLIRLARAAVLLLPLPLPPADPWPVEADGQGLSLHRVTPTSYGNDPANWQAAPPSPAQAGR